MAGADRLLVIGLDCAAPQCVFGEDAYDLPNLRALAAKGCWGPLRSCDPPITVPAWASMTTGRVPGALGVYGFRNRADYSYAPMQVADASWVKHPRVWDLLSGAGQDVIVVGVPQTWPVRPVNGCLVSGSLMPSTEAQFTYPKRLAREITGEVGAYIPDASGYRTEDKDALLTRLHALMENRFAVTRHLMQSKPWRFCMMVEMGIDRLHHAFWRYMDPAHPLHEPGHPYGDAARDYYQAVDRRIGELIALAGEGVAVMVVSDHGAKAMHGGVCINQWLIDEGLLALKDTPSEPTPLETCAIDWSRTKAWSTGGYYARVFLNVASREPEGIVPPEDYQALRAEIIAKLESMPGPEGALLGNQVSTPETLYGETNGIPPDLLAYFGNLHWRAVGTVGSDSLFTKTNPVGPDDANHAHEGIFLAGGDGIPNMGKLSGADILDLAPTVLKLMRPGVPPDMQGTPLW